MRGISSSPLWYCWNPGGRRKRVKRGNYPSFVPSALFAVPPSSQHGVEGGRFVRLQHHRLWLHREISLSLSLLFSPFSMLVNTLHSYCQDRWEVCERSLSLLINYRARADLNFVRRNLRGNAIWQNIQWRIKGMRNRRLPSPDNRWIKGKKKNARLLYF